MKHFRSILCCLLPFVFTFQAHCADLIHFWDTPKHGANVFNRLPANSTLYPALAHYQFSWVRLSYDKWQSKHKDFLIGDASHFKILVPEDLKRLQGEINKAGKAGLKVVIAPLSLPMARAKQLNNYVYDERIWQTKKNWQPSIEFWKQLAAALKNSPYIAAFNIINEPAPEENDGLAEHANKAQHIAWYRKIKGTSRDLRAYYQQVIAAIRSVDPLTPIMVDAGWYGAADDFSYWPSALPDNKLLYSFHMYEPYDFTSVANYRKNVRYRYPGFVPFADNNESYWDKRHINQYVNQPLKWAQRVGIPKNRMVAAEFGCVRKLDSCKRYLSDVSSVLSSQGLSWAFYSFREDDWDEMNYELGTKKSVPESFWTRSDHYLSDKLKYHDSPLFEVLRQN